MPPANEQFYKAGGGSTSLAIVRRELKERVVLELFGDSITSLPLDPNGRACP